MLLWLASDWPMHDISEEYLFSMHMTQHMVLTYMVPPVMLLATPEWLARLVLGRGRGQAGLLLHGAAGARGAGVQRLLLGTRAGW